MFIRIAFVATLLLLSACNLSNSPTGGPTETAMPTSAAATGQPLPTALPGVVPLPDSSDGLPTRTPVGAPAANNPLLPTPDAIPTSPTGESAIISSPIQGSVVASGVLQVSGVVIGLARDEFTLVLADAQGRVLNSQLITLQNPNNVDEVPWSAAMTTGPYTGPAEIRIIGQNAQGEDLLLARVSITLGANAGGATTAPLGSARSGSPQGSIISPVNGAIVPGDTVQVSGTAGGIPENQFLLVLVAADGSVINSQIVMLSNDDYTQIVPWAASLGAGGYRGPAEIRAMTTGASQTTFASIQLTLQ